MVTLIRVINKGYFVAMTMSPEGNLGKGRYLLRVMAPTLAQELEGVSSRGAPRRSAGPVKTRRRRFWC